MRKRLISFALAATIMVSTSLPAFATKKFDMSVFDGKDYVGVVTDDMTGWTFAFPRFGTIEEGGTYIVSDDDSRLSASSSLYLNDTYDFYYLDFNRTGSFASGFNSVIVKIGDNRYNFSNGQTDSTVSETSVYKGYKRDKIEMRGDRAEISDFPLYLNTVAGGLDCRDQTIGGFSFVVKIYAVPVVEIIG